MKAMVVSPVGGRVPPTRGVLHNGLGLNNGGTTRRDMEAEEVAAYLTKLRSLVPDMPRKRKLSKLEVIQRVIEYICDLQTTLEETNVPDKTTTTTTITTTTMTTTTTTSSSQVHINNNNINSNNNNNNNMNGNQIAQRQPFQPLLNATTAPATIAMATTSSSSTSSSALVLTTNDTSSGSSQR